MIACREGDAQLKYQTLQNLFRLIQFASFPRFDDRDRHRRQARSALVPRHRETAHHSQEIF